jgi:hypothetical protein
MRPHIRRLAPAANSAKTKMSRKKKRKRLWTLLNGLWTLFNSAVVVGLIAFGYTQVSQRIDARGKRAKTIIKLDDEISKRLNTVREDLQGSPSKYEWAQGMKSLSEFGLGKVSSQDSDANIYPEYVNESVYTLMLDLRNLIPKGEKPQMASALSALAEIEKLDGHLPPDAASRIAAVQRINDKALGLICTKLNIRSWLTPGRNCAAR